MIHTIVYAFSTGNPATLYGPYNVAPPGYTGPKTIQVWDEVRKILEQTGDTFVWVVTTEQLDGFMERVRSNKLEKYLKVRMDGKDQGTSNRNYPDRPRRLKVFVMKGVGE